MRKQIYIAKSTTLYRQQPLQPSVSYEAKLNELRIAGAAIIPCYALRPMLEACQQAGMAVYVHDRLHYQGYQSVILKIKL